MTFLETQEPIYIDFHNHNSIRKESNVIEITSIHLGKEPKNHNFYTIGKHPWWTTEVLKSEEIDNLKKHYNSPYCLALGEMGLDNLKGPELKNQEEILRSQLEVAQELNAPVIIHCVRAYDQLLKIKREFPKIKNWCIHGFARNSVLAGQLIHEGFYLSLMPQQRINSQKLSLLQSISIDRLFLETDSIPGTSIEEIYTQTAVILEISVRSLQQQIMLNAKSFFDI